MIDGEYELVLPNSVKKVVFIDGYILITIDDLDGSILLFKRQEKSWVFVDRLESFEHQSLINRRLNHVYYEGNAITFVFNVQQSSAKVRSEFWQDGCQSTNTRCKEQRIFGYRHNEATCWKIAWGKRILDHYKLLKRATNKRRIVKCKLQKPSRERH